MSADQAAQRPAGLRLVDVALVAVGGFAGGLLRYALVLALPGSLPWGVLSANMIGSVLLGMVVGVIVRGGRGRTWVRLLVGVGFCGALTTFSSLVVAVDRMIGDGRAGAAAIYLLLSLAGGLLAVGLGLRLGEGWARRGQDACESSGVSGQAGGSSTAGGAIATIDDGQEW